MRQDGSMPRIPVLLEVSPELGIDDTRLPALNQEISRDLADTLRVLGVPGVPAVRTTVTGAAGKALCLAVNGEQCHYPDELLWKIHSHMNRAPLAKLPLAEVLKSARGDVAEFLRLCCLNIVQQHPAVLFGSEQAAAFRETLPTPSALRDDWPASADWLSPIMRKVLDQRISIANRQAVADLLREGLLKGRSAEQLSEELIASLKPGIAEIQLSADYLRQLSTADAGRGGGDFSQLRGDLFNLLGLRYPNFSFVAVGDLDAGSFRFKINHLTTLPRTGLQPKQLLVNEDVDRLALSGIQGKAAINPDDGRLYACIDSADEERAVSAGLLTWNPMEYLVLCFAAELKEQSACFVSSSSVKYELDQLALDLPALAKAVLSSYTLEQVTDVLRRLVAEGISIRNLRSILERLLDFDYTVADPASMVVLDDRLPFREEPDPGSIGHPAILTAFVRTGLQRYMTQKYLNGRDRLGVYLLDPQIEEMLPKYESHYAEFNTADRNRILELFRACPAVTSPDVAILTVIDVRSALKRILASELPKLPVISHQELSPYVYIEPIATITWAGAGDH